MSRAGFRVVLSLALLVGLFLCPSPVHAWNLGHRKITEAALKSLPDWQQTKWRDERRAFRRYCIYPDMGIKNPESKPYLLVIKGRLFHYFPKDNLKDYTLFNDGAEQYVRLIVERMRKGEYTEAAKFAGAMAHVIEDLGQPQCHAMEGVNGFSWTVLDELFTPEDQTWNRAPQSIIGIDDDARFKVDLGDYAPRLLGTRPKEIAFRLYQRCCRLRQVARKALPPMLIKTYAGDKKGAIEAAARVAVENARLVADLFHTCFSLAGKRFDPAQVKALQTLDLTALVPIKTPVYISLPYRFSALSYGRSVTVDRKPVPLEVWLPRQGGGKREVVLAKGIGTGACKFRYEIPAGVFAEFRCIAGLHARLGTHKAGANLQMMVRFRGQEVFNSGVLGAGSLAKQVVVPLEKGGTLEFITKGSPVARKNYANHAVWGTPVLVRLAAAKE